MGSSFMPTCTHKHTHRERERERRKDDEAYDGGFFVYSERCWWRRKRCLVIRDNLKRQGYIQVYIPRECSVFVRASYNYVSEHDLREERFHLHVSHSSLSYFLSNAVCITTSYRVCSGWKCNTTCR